jgi:hypothetical protein
MKTRTATQTRNLKTGIAAVLLSVVAATTLVAATEAPFVERHVLGFNVSLVVAPPSGVTNFLVREMPPFGHPGNISHGGTYDSATRTILFGPFDDGQSRLLTYTDPPPLGSYGRFAFTGEAVANGASSAIVGDDYTEIPQFPALDVRLLLRWRPLSRQVAIQLIGGSGAPCFILASTNLQNWVSLGDLGSVFQGFELVDAAAPNHPYRFYRAQTIPPPAQPLGDWQYEGYDAQGSLIVTGMVTFVTATTPLAGSWDFQPVHLPYVSGHYVGQESFIDGELSGQRATVSKMRAIDDEFVLSGQMGSDVFAGTWQHHVEGPTETGSFMARRIGP